MSPPAVSSSADIGLYCSDEDLFMLLEKIIIGSPLPGNVITDINPYRYKPWNLPGKHLVLINYKRLGAKAYLTIFFYFK